MTATLRSTQRIREGHEAALSKLAAFERAVNVPASTAMDSAVEALSTYLRTEVWSLVWKEEDALMPLVKACVPQNAGALEQMHVEHDELRKANEQLQSAVAAYRADPNGRGTTTAVREAGVQIGALLRRHFSAEDAAVLAVADAYLDEQQDKRILDEFSAIDADLAWGFENLQEFYP
jgi:hemerythrin-like domain-containing protein